MTLIGVDLGIHKINTAVYTHGDSGLTLYTVPSHVAQTDSRPAQLWELSRFLVDLTQSYDADHVWIEDIILGNNRKYSLQLAQVLGACLAAMALVQGTCDVHLVDNKTWKKAVVGNGNASKEDVKNYIVESHPSYAALCEDEQDAIDAACVGLYGLTIHDRAEHLTL